MTTAHRVLITFAVLGALGADSPDTIHLSANPSDQEVWAKFPQLESVPRIDVCSLSLTRPIRTSLIYEPQLLEESHVVRTRWLLCNGYPDRLECQFESQREAFDANPHHSFALGAGVTLEDGLRIVRAFDAKRLLPHVSWPGFYNPDFRIQSIVHDGRNYVLNLGMCGCGGTVRIDAELGTELKVVGEPDASCI